jgi:hypothetical protein
VKDQGPGEEVRECAVRRARISKGVGMSKGSRANHADNLGRLLRVLFSGIVALVFSTGLFAQAKGLYYGGYLWDFATWQGGGLGVDQYAWDGSNLNLGFSDSFPVNPVGSLGVCVFNSKIYCFYTSAGPNSELALGYVTLDPATFDEAGPTTIATGLGGWPGNSGVAAAVCGDAIYVFTPGIYGFTSKDGKNFTAWTFFTNACCNSNKILDAVTFYPTGNDPASLMLVYYDTSAVLDASIFSPPNRWSTQDFILPWPPASPYLWNPIAMGNLVLGTSGGGLGTPGAKAPCVQFFGLTGQGQDGTHEGRWEYNIASRTWSFYDWTISNNENSLEVFPWSDTVDTLNGMMHMSHLASCWRPGVNTIKVGSSDYMVPQHNDPVYGWAGTPTPTSNASGSELQSLWTLVGVVLGPPPFPLNGVTNACTSAPDALAWVDYGKDTSTTVTTTSTSSSTISVAVNSSIRAGIGQFSLDLSYAHAWTSSHGTSQTVSVSQDFQFGPCSEQPGNQGTSGWAIFNAPTMVTQWYKLYAYDYSQSTGQGTYLDQDIYATALGATVQQTAYFDLADPSQGEYPGLFAGMTVYPSSTDMSGWHLGIPDWDNGGSDWTAVFGDTTDPQMPVLNLGLRDEVSYTESDTTTDSHGNSNSFGVQAGAGISFAGFGAGVTVGYDGKWTTNTENASTITQDVSCALNVRIPPNTTGYVNSLTVQPFWLQATTTNAPWLPSAYNGDLPWCVTWAVTQYGTVGGGTAGLAAAPSSASGTIRHGGDKAKDSYTLSGGRMAWMNADGSETPAPMTADQFDPSQGASVSLSGHIFSADGSNGKWVRKGEVWKYTTREGVKKDPFSLVLNCADETWSFDGFSKTLDDVIQPAEGSVRVGLGLQGSYGFTTWLRHEVDTTWSHSEKRSGWQAYGVHEIEGAYGSRTGVGSLKLKGHIPKRIGSFGDVEIRINGSPVQFPLLATEGFLEHLKNGGNVSYRADGLAFDIDFGSGMWKATIEGRHFEREMAPKNGAMRVQVLLGGDPISDQKVQLQKCTTGLHFAG